MYQQAFVVTKIYFNVISPLKFQTRSLKKTHLKLCSDTKFCDQSQFLK